MKSKLYILVTIALFLFLNFKGFSQTNTSLSNLASPTAVNQDLLPNSNNILNLGSVSKSWKTLYIDNNIYLKDSLFLNAKGTQNTFVGQRAGYDISTGSNNAAYGFHALYNNTTGGYNSAFGSSALANNTASSNTAFGYRALYSNTTGASNTATGRYALYQNTTGDNNVAAGYQSLYSNTTGQYNIATGYSSLYANTTGTFNAATGFEALYNNTTGSNNVAGGGKALYTNTTGYSNIGIGIKALYSNTSGSNSVALGDSVLYKSTGSYNVGIGSKVLYNNVTGSHNTALGYNANVNGSSNINATAIGSNAYAACSNCMVLGSVTGNNGAATGINVGIGTAAPKAALNIIGTKPVSLADAGYLQLGDSVSYNIGMDNQQIQARNNGSYSDIQFNSYGGQVFVGNITNSYYGLLAYGAEAGVYGNGYGYGGYFVTSHGTGVFGYCGAYQGKGVYGSVNASSANAVYGVAQGTYSYGVYAYSADSHGLFAQTSNSSSYAGYFSGNIFSTGTYTSSDEKLKQNITDVSTAMSIINQLKPKYYNFRQDGSYKKMNLPQGKHYGLIAQDVEKVLPGLVKETSFDVDRATPEAQQAPPDPKNPAAPAAKPAVAKTGEVIDFKALNYTELIPIIIKGMQEINASKDSAINDLQNQIDQLKIMIANLSSVNGQQSTVISSASLAQNIPNPFTNSTSINYNLPQQYASAKLIITDKKGVVLKEMSLNAKGKGNLNVDAYTLAAGAYQYSLYVNNRLIDTKQMVLTK